MKPALLARNRDLHSDHADECKKKHEDRLKAVVMTVEEVEKYFKYL